MGNISKNFDAAEFACKCGCGYCSPSAKLVATLQALRDAAGAPLSVTSGCRCTLYNRQAGSTLIGEPANIGRGRPGCASASAHTRGEAADAASAGLTKEQLYALAVQSHKAGLLPWMSYVYKIKNSRAAIHIGVDNFKKRSTPYGGDG